MFHPTILLENLLSKTYWKISTSTKFHFQTWASKHKLKLTLFHDSLLMVPIKLNK